MLQSLVDVAVNGKLLVLGKRVGVEDVLVDGAVILLSRHGGSLVGGIHSVGHPVGCNEADGGCGCFETETNHCVI